jgi:hypothetical protein
MEMEYTESYRNPVHVDLIAKSRNEVDFDPVQIVNEILASINVS